MAMVLQLEDESGTPLRNVIDEDGVLSRLLPSTEATPCDLLQFIDPYGDTVFNGLQARRVCKEIERLIEGARGQGEIDLLHEMLGMAIECANGVHVYLRFVGD